MDTPEKLYFYWNINNSHVLYVLVGMAVMRGLNGDYYPKDDRKREELQLWTELYTMDNDKIEKLYQEVKELPEIQRFH